MAEVLLEKNFQIRGGDFDKAGETSDEVKQILKSLGVNSGLIRRAVIIIFEAEMNVVMYARRGVVTFTLTEDEIRLAIRDEGPGIEDIDKAMTEGFSTATDEMRLMGFGFGMGLPNIRKNSDLFDIRSEVGAGTTVCSVVRLNHNAS